MMIIENLSVQVENTIVIRNFSLQVEPGKIHAIMGPNGAGKSTLAKVLAGHPDYEVVKGHIHFCGEDLLAMEPEERAHRGIFMGFQYPIEIPGITNFQFLLSALQARQKALGTELIQEDTFKKQLSDYLSLMKIPEKLMERSLNDGFSGGEKKRNEILQMFVLNPQFVVLDETDSGLDIDALKVVAEGVNHFLNPTKSLLLITHYQRLLDYIIPDFVHVMVDGRIVKTGNADLARELEATGYTENAVLK